MKDWGDLLCKRYEGLWEVVGEPGLQGWPVSGQKLWGRREVEQSRMKSVRDVGLGVGRKGTKVSKGTSSDRSVRRMDEDKD